MTRIGFTSTIAIAHPVATVDRYNNAVYTFPDGAPTEAVDSLVALQPTSQAEATGDLARIATTETFRLITQPGVDIPLSSIDRVIHAGRPLEVVGEVARWPHPMIAGGVHHVEATLRYVKG